MPTAIYLNARETGHGRSSAKPKAKKAEEVKKKKPVEEKKKKPKTTPTKLPRKATYPRWWKEVKTAGINFASAGLNQILAAQCGIRYFITSIVFTVSAETNITFSEGGFFITGPMDFGGTGEPRGIVISMGDSPMMLSPGAAFFIHSTAAVQVSGFITYLTEVVEPPPEK